MLLAPSFEPAALEILQTKKNVRLLELPDWPARSERVEGRAVLGGQLVQTHDEVAETREQMHAMTAAEPDEQQWQDLLFAWRVCRHVRSNAIVIARGRATIGIGAGQMSRVDAVRIAVEKAQAFQPELLAGSSLASDAYFPFADGPELALRGRGHRDHPAGRLGPRRGGRGRRQRRRGLDGRHRHAPLPPLRGASANARPARPGDFVRELLRYIA